MNSLENHTQSPQRIANEYTTLADLELNIQHTLSKLDEAIELVSVHNAQLKNTIQSENRSNTVLNSTASESESTPSAEAPFTFSSTIEEVFAVGVLDENAWQSMEKDITAMSKEESRAFWEKMIVKIEQDEILIVD